MVKILKADIIGSSFICAFFPPHPLLWFGQSLHKGATRVMLSWEDTGVRNESTTTWWGGGHEPCNVFTLERGKVPVRKRRDYRLENRGVVK